MLGRWQVCSGCMCCPCKSWSVQAWFACKSKIGVTARLSADRLSGNGVIGSSRAGEELAVHAVCVDERGGRVRWNAPGITTRSGEQGQAAPARLQAHAAFVSSQTSALFFYHVMPLESMASGHA